MIPCVLNEKKQDQASKIPSFACIEMNDKPLPHISEIDNLILVVIDANIFEIILGL